MLKTGVSTKLYETAGEVGLSRQSAIDTGGKILSSRSEWKESAFVFLQIFGLKVRLQRRISPTRPHSLDLIYAWRVASLGYAFLRIVPG